MRFSDSFWASTGTNWHGKAFRGFIIELVLCIHEIWIQNMLGPSQPKSCIAQHIGKIQGRNEGTRKPFFLKSCFWLKKTFLLASKRLEVVVAAVLPVFNRSWRRLQKCLIVFHAHNTRGVQINFCNKVKNKVRKEFSQHENYEISKFCQELRPKKCCALQYYWLDDAIQRIK